MKLLVWDFDGTLADSRPLIVAGMEHALRGLGLQDREDLRREWLSCVGLPVEEGLRRTFGSLGLDLDEVLKVYRSFDWLAHDPLVQPFPGMTELVLELHGRGVKMAIASSKRTPHLARQIGNFGWTACFDPLITPDQVAQGKPHPESLEQCLKIHGVAASEALMIGDTPFDLDMASAAGVPSLGVCHGFYSREALEACGPVACVTDTAELRSWLIARL